MKPLANLMVHDIIDVYNIKKNTPNIKEKRLYRVAMCSFENDKLINRIAIKMKDFDIFTGQQQLCVKEVPFATTKNWSDYKLIQPFVKDFKPHEETTALDLKEFIKFCKENKITEKMLWQILLDDTYSKSEELLSIFYPTIIPIPFHATHLQRYNSHGVLVTRAKTGKSETCYRLYPHENFENVSIATLLGTNDGTTEKIGLLTGTGLFFYDEINKLSDTRFGESSYDKPLDHINTYLEKGIEQRGVRGHTIKAQGTKTIIFSGNINIINHGARDFFHIMTKICNFGNDSDKFGRRLAFVIYSPTMQHVTDAVPINQNIIDIINAFRNEIIKSETLKTKITKILENALSSFVQIDDNEHKEKIKSFSSNASSLAIKAFLNGMAISNDKKLKFMAIRIAICNNIFEIIQKNTLNFYEDHKKEVEDIYKNLKETICYKQIPNYLYDDITIMKKIKEKHIENNIHSKEELTEELIKKISKEIDTSEINIKLFSSKLFESNNERQE